MVLWVGGVGGRGVEACVTASMFAYDFVCLCSDVCSIRDRLALMLPCACSSSTGTLSALSSVMAHSVPSFHARLSFFRPATCRGGGVINIYIMTKGKTKVF